MTELFFFPAFLATKVFLNVLSDWFHDLKIVLTQEKVNKSHILGFAMLPDHLPLFQMLAGLTQAGLWFQMVPTLKFAPDPWKCPAERGIRVLHRNAVHMCAWAWALQNSGGFIPVGWRLFKWHVDVYINEAVIIKTRRKRWNIVIICARATPAGSWKLSRGLPALISLPAGMYLYVKMPGRKICCSALGVNGFLNRPKDLCTLT